MFVGQKHHCHGRHRQEKIEKSLNTPVRWRHCAIHVWQTEWSNHVKSFLQWVLSVYIIYVCAHRKSHKSQANRLTWLCQKMEFAGPGGHSGKAERPDENKKVFLGCSCVAMSKDCNPVQVLFVFCLVGWKDRNIVLVLNHMTCLKFHFFQQYSQNQSEVEQFPIV